MQINREPTIDAPPPFEFDYAEMELSMMAYFISRMSPERIIEILSSLEPGPERQTFKNLAFPVLYGGSLSHVEAIIDLDVDSADKIRERADRRLRDMVEGHPGT